jgi:hypothetical protein
MPTGGRKINNKHLLSATARHHLKTVESEKRQAAVKEGTWNYNEFVARVLKIFVLLHTRDGQKNDPGDQ